VKIARKGFKRYATPIVRGRPTPPLYRELVPAAPKEEAIIDTPGHGRGAAIVGPGQGSLDSAFDDIAEARARMPPFGIACTRWKRDAPCRRRFSDGMLDPQRWQSYLKLRCGGCLARTKRQMFPAAAGSKAALEEDPPGHAFREESTGSKLRLGPGSKSAPHPQGDPWDEKLRLNWNRSGGAACW